MNTKDKKINNFFNSHKQSIDGEDFNKKLSELLNYYSKPVVKQRRVNSWIIHLFTLLGLFLFTFFGGASLLFEYAIPVFVSYSTPHTIYNYSAVLIMLSIVAGMILYIVKVFDLNS